MVRSYTKYEQSHSFGIVTSASANIVWSPPTGHLSPSSRSTGAGSAYTGANEEILVWEIKTGELKARWRDSDCTTEATVIAQSSADADIFATGYADGSIRIWDSPTASVLISFNGHQSGVTTLSFDKSGTKLASGAKDTDIIIWDLVGEVGLYKLRGHKDQITGLRFLDVGSTNESEEEMDVMVDLEGDRSFLVSTSKDALIKIWDVSSQHCVETHVAQTNGECWALGVSPDLSGCITAGNDGEVRVWTINPKNLRDSAKTLGDADYRNILQDRGTVHRHGKDRPLGVSFHESSDYVAIHGSEKAVEIWRFRSEKEVQKALSRKRRRKREKAADKAAEDADESTSIGIDSEIEAELADIFVSSTIIRTGGKVRSTAWIRGKSHKELKLVLATSNNMIESYDVSRGAISRKSKDEGEEYSRTLTVDLPGHRTDVRAISLSSDDRMLASASNGSLKIWNLRTQNCLRTLECGYALCCTFLPGDKIVVIGTKTGELEMFDIASSTLIDKFEAHDGSIWTLEVHPNGKSVVTGSADKSVKFWNFEIVQEEIPGTKRTMQRLKLVHIRTLKVNDDILSIRFSPDSRLIAVATLDNTVKVFFVDTLKLFLNLYGHKLPVLSMSISSDSKLIATCSADKNIRLWGLDFGDCHRAFFAHQDSIMQVAFIPHPISRDEGHQFFSASKDNLIKSWDGDKFEQVQKLIGHHGEIWTMAVSSTGDFFVTASHDKSIRVWSRSDEPIFLEEEREREMEELYESTLATSLGVDDPIDGGEPAEVAAASKQTIATLTAGEMIAEALELGIEDLQLVRAWQARKAANPAAAPPQRNPLFTALGGISAERHVLNTVARIPAAQLHDALLVLPFSTLPALFAFVTIWVRRQWHTALVCRILFFMLATHQQQIVASRELKTVLQGMRADLRDTLGGMKDALGFNLAALRFVGNRVRDHGVATLEDFEREEDILAKGQRKRAFVDVS